MQMPIFLAIVVTCLVSTGQTSESKNEDGEPATELKQVGEEDKKDIAAPNADFRPAPMGAAAFSGNNQNAQNGNRKSRKSNNNKKTGKLKTGAGTNGKRSGNNAGGNANAKKRRKSGNSKSDKQTVEGAGEYDTATGTDNGQYDYYGVYTDTGSSGGSGRNKPPCSSEEDAGTGGRLRKGGKGKRGRKGGKGSGGGGGRGRGNTNEY